MGVALVSDLSDKIVRYGIPRGFIPGIVKGCPLDRVQQRRTRHAAFFEKGIGGKRCEVAKLLFCSEDVKTAALPPCEVSPDGVWMC